MGLGIPRTRHFLFSFLFGSFPNSNILFASISYIHRPPAIMRDYISVGGCDLLSSRSRFHYSVSSVLLVCLCISIAFCADGVDPPLLFPFRATVAAPVFFLCSWFLVSRVFSSLSPYGSISMHRLRPWVDTVIVPPPRREA